MKTMCDLLFEIGVEELPAGYISPAVSFFCDSVKIALKEHGILWERDASFATPRRLVLFFENVAEKEPDRCEKIIGPPQNICLKEGQPTKAYEKFMEKNTLTEKDVFWEETEKGIYLAAKKDISGRMTKEIIAEAWPRILTAIPFPKKMKWDDSGFLFARPVRWVLALWGEELLTLNAGSVAAGQETRLLRNSVPDRKTISSPKEYFTVMEKSGIVLSPEKRRSVILDGIKTKVKEYGADSFYSEELAEEVVYLVESPQVLAGSFQDQYLSLPPDVISAAMSQHQRYFSLYKDGKILPVFVFVANGSFHKNSEVIKGNERVLKARLDDAMFYWKEDVSRGPEKLYELLDSITWMEGLGSLKEKTNRLVELTAGLSNSDPTAMEGARYAKIDIASEMIKDGKEFTKLQGLIAKYYLLEHQIEKKVADIAEQHYWPRVWGEALPNRRAAAVSLADKADNIVGAFIKGFIPTGTKDPYALRRQANSMIALLLGYEGSTVHPENGFPLQSADEFFERCVKLYSEEMLPSGEVCGILSQVKAFFDERFKAQLKALDIPYDIVDAVCDTPDKSLTEKYTKALAFKSLSRREEFRDVAATFRRVNNIVKKAREELNRDDFGTPDPKVFVEKETIAMYDHWLKSKKLIREAGNRYEKIFDIILEFKSVVDVFFDTVLVMDKDERMRNNRLALLQDISALFSEIVNFDHIVVT